MVRDPDAAGLPAGVEAVKGDLSDPETLEAALQGVASVFLVWPFFAAKGAPAVVEAIVKHARRVVYLPSEGVRDGAREQAQWGQRANAWGSFDFAMDGQHSGNIFPVVRPYD